MKHEPRPTHTTKVRTFLILQTVFFAVSLLVAAVAWAADAPDPTTAKREDKSVKSLVAQLEKKLAKASGLDDAPGVVLYRSFEFQSEQKSHLAIRNYVVLVNDPESSLVKTWSMSFPGNAEVEYLGGWVFRKNKVKRLEEGQWRVENTGPQTAQKVLFTPDELQEGDIVCYSVEARQDYPYGGGYLRLSGPLPVLLSNTRIKTGGILSLDFLGQNLVRDKHARKVYKEKEEYPVDIKYTVVDIPADRSDPDAPLYLEYQPYLLAYPKAQYNEMAETWMAINSWNMVAVQASGYRTRLEESLDTVRGKSQELTAGLAQPAEKADAIHRFIQDEIDLECFVDYYGSREPADVLVSKKGTRGSKAALMYVMCKSLELPVDILLARDQGMGRIDRSVCVMQQFTDFVIVLESEPVRYYVPSAPGCPPGALPEGLKGMKALSTEPDLQASFREVAMEAMGKSSADPKSASSVFNGLLDQQDWAEWVTLP